MENKYVNHVTKAVLRPQGSEIKIKIKCLNYTKLFALLFTVYI